MATMDQNSNAALQGIARHINCLTEDNRNTRKKALEGIKRDTLGRNPPLDELEMKHLFSELIKPLLKMISDPVEKCREMSIELIKGFLERVRDPESSLSYIVPVLVQRLGQQDITEPSEELRFLLIELSSQIIEFSGKKISVYLDDYIKILVRTIVDPFPEVKKESCKCAGKLAKSIPEYFHDQSETLIKPLLLAITHQHSRVRVIVVETIGYVIQYGNGKSVETVVPHFAQRLFDQSPAVRKAVVKVVGYWLLDLPDRYSFHHKLMPLLLTGISDEQPDIQELADSLWNDVGLKYLKENEEEMKDKINFEEEKPDHYPTGIERPNLGCRTLIMRHVSKVIPGLMKDILDWVVATRLKSASLLYTLLLNAEDYITQHMEPVLSGLYRASLDEEKQVVRDVKRSSELIGYFVPPEVWCKLVLKSAKASQSYGTVMVLSSIMRGTSRSLLQPYLQTISSVFLLPEICHTAQSAMHNELLSCVQAMLSVVKEDIRDVSQQVFDLIITVLAQNQEEEISIKSHTLLDELYMVQTLESKEELFSRHTKPLIDSFKSSYDMWNIYSVERLVFDTLILEAGPVVGEQLDEIFPVLVTNFNPDKDPEVRLKFFSLLSKLMMSVASTLDSKQRFADFSVCVIKDIIIPNLVWKAGRVSGAIRTTAVSCMWALLQSGVLTQEKVAPVIEDLLTQLLSSFDDTNKTTRLISCRVMTRVFELSGPTLCLDRLHNIYPDLLKRLDDSDDEVRIVVATTFLAYLDSLEGRYDTGLYKAHLEAMYKGLLVHLDDPDQNIQKTILGVLKKAAVLDPFQLMSEVENVKHKHRSTKFCEELIKHTKDLAS